MRKINMVSRNDWVKMGAGLDASCKAALGLYVMLANSLGKAHPDTKKALSAYNKVICMKADIRRLVKENASGIFGQKELDSLFPDLPCTRKQNRYSRNDLHFKKGGIAYGAHNE